MSSVGSLAIFQAIVNACWSLIKWGLVLSLAAGLLVAYLVYYRVDEEIRREVVRRLEQHYQDLDVTLRSARWIDGEGVELRGLTLFEQQAPGPQAELAHLEEVVLYSKTALREMVTGWPEFDHIVLRRPTLRATLRADGTWSFSKLLPLPLFTDIYPQVTIENATVEIFDPSKNPTSTMTFRDVTLELKPNEPTTPGGVPDYHLDGHLMGDFIQRIDATGSVAIDGQHVALQGNVEGLDLCPEFQAALPAPAAESLEAIRSLRAQVRSTFRLAYDANRPEPIEFSLDGSCHQGRLEDPRLPYLLGDLNARVHCDNQGVVITELTARSGQSTLWASGQRWGYEADSPITLRAIGRRLRLDERLARAELVPPAWRAEWDRYLPDGEVDANILVRFDGKRWIPDECVVRCLNVSFTHYKFPYRLERAEGSLTYRDQQLNVGLRAFSGGEEVNLRGVWQNADDQGWGELTLTAENVPFDEKLFRALDPASSQALRSVHPRGTFRFDATLRQPAGSPAPPVSTSATIVLNRCSIKYDDFPYPLDDVRGQIRLENGVWTWDGLSATNDSGIVESNGRVEPTPDGHFVVVNFNGSNVTLEEELRDALPNPSHRQLWNDFKLRGSIHFRAQASHIPGRPGLNVWARVWPQEGSTSVEPSFFPYRVENLKGEIFLQDGHVDVIRMTGDHGQTRMVEMSATCDMWGDGGWRADVQRLIVDRLQVDRELSRALPPRLRENIRQLDPQGAINMEGRLQIAGGGQLQHLITSNWDLSFDMENGSIVCADRISHLHGGVDHFRGSFDGRHYQARGELKVDSAMYRDFQLTNVRGPLWLEDNRLLFGVPATQQGEPVRHVTAEAYGGLLYADGGLTQGPTPSYRVDVTVSNADLARLAQELLTGRQGLRGKILAQVHLEGQGTAAHNLNGRGNVQLREADIYELPLMVRLLSVLSVKAPDRTAFTESNVNFRIDAGHIYFDNIDFHGPAISLKGTGEMNLDQQIGLNFFAAVGSQEMYVPVIGDLMRGASQGIMQIRVDGKLNDPEIHRQTLPGVKRGLEQLGLTKRAKEAPTMPPGESTARRSAPRTVPPPGLVPQGALRQP